jgi:pimeloyl-ACP methyl ester carboxylesterase
MAPECGVQNAAAGLLTLSLWLSGTHDEAMTVITLLALTALQQQLSPCTEKQFGPGAQCGLLQRAEDSTKPNGRSISIRFVVLPAQGTRQAEPVLLFVGGPGVGSTTLAGLANGPFNRVRKTRDFVLVDQRGTGGSNALMCLAEVASHPERAFGHVFDPKLFQRCRADLPRQADLTRYTTDIAVADIDAVRESLGYDRVILWGGSYGTRLAQAYTRRHPEHVMAVVLDGVVPFDFSAPLTYAATLQQSLDRLLASCTARVFCRDSFPDLKPEFGKLVRKLRRGPAPVFVKPKQREPVPVMMHLGDFGYAVRGILYRRDQSPQLPAMIHTAATTGDLSPFAQRYWERAADFEEEFADGLHFSIFCAEDVPFMSEEEITAATTGTFIGRYLIDEYRQICSEWPRASIAPDFRQPLDAPVPTLLVSGYFDPVTPPEMAERVARHLPMHRHIVDSLGHHGSSFGCAWSAVLYVLEKGTLDGMPAVCGQ